MQTAHLRSGDGIGLTRHIIRTIVDQLQLPQNSPSTIPHLFKTARLSV